MTAEGPPGPGAAARSAAAARLRRCRRGATALEFAAVSTVLIPMLMAISEFAFEAAIGVALDRAALKASRAGSLGRENPDGTRSGQACDAAIREAALAAGGGLLSSSYLTVEEYNYRSAAASVSDGPNRGNGAKGAGLGGHTVVYQLRYVRPSFFTKPINTAWGAIGRDSYTHTSVVTVQNEPFAPGAATAPVCS